MANSNLLTKEQTCVGSGYNFGPKCISAERSDLELKEIRTDEDRLAWVKKYKSGIPKDPDGFYVCHYCKKLRRDQLVQCPECHRYFKGPRPNFSINYECEECDV